MYIGDTVEISTSKAIIERLQTPLYGGCPPATLKTLGKTGIVKHISCNCFIKEQTPDCTITVNADKMEVVLNPKAVKLIKQGPREGIINHEHISLAPRINSTPATPRKSKSDSGDFKIPLPKPDALVPEIPVKNDSFDEPEKLKNVNESLEIYAERSISSPLSPKMAPEVENRNEEWSANNSGGKMQQNPVLRLQRDRGSSSSLPMMDKKIPQEPVKPFDYGKDSPLSKVDLNWSISPFETDD